MENKIEASWEDEYQSFDWRETFVIDEIPLNNLWEGKSTDLRLALDKFHRENGVVKECTKHYMAFEPVLPNSFNSIFSAFKDKTYSYNFLKLTGSYNIPMHYDSYSTFTKKFNVDEDKINKIKRTVVMITPWADGQTLQIGKNIYSHWNKGSTYTWEGQEWHGAGNFGFKDLVVMQVTWI